MNIFKSKEFKILSTFIFIGLTFALILKFYFMNRINYDNYLVNKMQKDKQELICINKNNNKAYRTGEDEYELIKVKTSCFNNLSEHNIFFKKKNLSFNILDCHLYKKVNSQKD